MKTLENIATDIKRYLQERFVIEKGMWSLQFTKEEHDALIDTFLDTYYTHPEVIETYRNRFTRQRIETQDLSEIAHQESLIMLPALFIIREYYNPSLGKGVRIDNNTIYNAIVGSGDYFGVPLPTFYAKCLSFALIDNDIKLICERTVQNGFLPNGMIRWDVRERSVFADNDLRIVDDGELKNVLRIEAPEAQESLEEYGLG